MAENDMKQILAIIVASIALVGCRSSQTGEPITLDTFHETTIYAQLKDEPIPLPNENPYGNNSGQRESYIEGFRGGWDWAISGALLRGTFVTPTDLPDAEHAAWSAGWELGAKMGSDRWMKERDKIQNEGGQQSVAPYRR